MKTITTVLFPNPFCNLNFSALFAFKVWFYLFFNLISTSFYSQTAKEKPIPILERAYLDYNNILLFSNPENFPDLLIDGKNCSIHYIDSNWYVRPTVWDSICMIRIREAKTLRFLGFYTFYIQKLPSPTIYLDLVATGGTLNGSEEYLRCGFDHSTDLANLNYTILSYQLFFENHPPSGVYPGNELPQTELLRIHTKVKDGIKTKLNIVCQVRDHNGNIFNCGGCFFL